MNKFSEFRKKNERLETVVVLLCLTVLAALIRSPGLGKWCLNADEYYFSRSVSFIVEKLVPEFPSGGYYTRGLLLQYLTTIPVLLFKNFEFAVRIIPLICGILSIPVFYLICKNHLSTLPAVLCTSMLLLSSWHIEFSRFARMYSPFQFVFLLFIYFFYSGYWKENRKHQLVSWSFAFLLIFLHAASIFIPFILVLALFRQKSLFSRRGMELIIVIVALLGFNFLIHKLDWFNYLLHGVNYKDWIVKNRFPLGISPPFKKSGPLVMPRFDLFNAVWNSYTSGISYPLLVLFGVLVLAKQKNVTKGFFSTFLVLLTFSLPLIHQFGLLACLLFIFFFWRKDSLDFLAANKRRWFSYFFVTFIFWIAFGFIYREQCFPNLGLLKLVEKIISNTLHYPRIRGSIITPYALSVPLWGAFALLAIAVSVIHRLCKEKTAHSFPLVITLSCILIHATIRTTYASTRYSFFYFPLVLLVGYIEAAYFAEKFAEKNTCKEGKSSLFYCLVFLPLIMFCFTRDFNPYHILHVSSEKANFRLGEYRKVTNHWYLRSDYRRSALFVNKAFNEGDIVVTDNNAVSHYLDKPFSIFRPIKAQGFWEVARKNGTEDTWTGQPLIGDFKALVGIVPAASQQSLWLVTTTVITRFFNLSLFPPTKLASANNLTAKLMFTGLDKRTEVWKFNRR